MAYCGRRYDRARIWQRGYIIHIGSKTVQACFRFKDRSHVRDTLRAEGFEVHNFLVCWQTKPELWKLLAFPATQQRPLSVSERQVINSK